MESWSLSRVLNFMFENEIKQLSLIKILRSSNSKSYLYIWNSIIHLFKILLELIIINTSSFYFKNFNFNIFCLKI